MESQPYSVPELCQPETPNLSAEGLARWGFSIWASCWVNELKIDSDEFYKWLWIALNHLESLGIALNRCNCVLPHTPIANVPSETAGKTVSGLSDWLRTAANKEECHFGWHSELNSELSASRSESESDLSDWKALALNAWSRKCLTDTLEISQTVDPSHSLPESLQTLSSHSLQSLSLSGVVGRCRQRVTLPEKSLAGKKTNRIFRAKNRAVF